MALQGFFKAAQEPAARRPLYLTPQCGVCKLHQAVDHGKMQVSGEGRRKIMIVGEAPGESEDAQGEPFVGTTGRLLEQTLAEWGIDMRQDCWIINVVRCRPWEWDKHKTKKLNREPTDKEIEWCRPYTTGTGDSYGDIKKLQPEVIILLGSVAVKSVVGWLWKEDPGGITRWAGWQIPCQRLNAWLCPAYHPSYVVREEKSPVVKLLWKRHLREACRLRRRPWPKGLPDYAGQVRVEMMPRQAAQYIDAITRDGKPASFDIETTTLKPDGPHAEIVCCAISNGVITVSFPWVGEGRQAALRFLTSKVPKIGFNQKFEQRWLMAREGVRVRRWVWDGMLAAHILDNRPEISGLKFQAFALLGQESYDDLVKPYFAADAPNKPNRIRKLDLRALLHYCGLDAVLEWKVAQVQSKKMGITLE